MARDLDPAATKGDDWGMKPMADIATGKWIVRVMATPPTFRYFETREDAEAWIAETTRGW